MKKLTALLLVAVMALTFAACGAKSGGKLTLATEATFPPYEYYEGDAITGIDVEIAGAIAEHQSVPPSTMSHHLATLERAGLVQSERESRLIHYRADFDGMRRLLTFLMQDCCQGAPEMCGDLLAEISCETVNL